MSSSDSDQLLPHPRRLVTGHRPDGSSTLLSDTIIPCERKPTGSNYAVLWETTSVPADCGNDGPNGEFFDPIAGGTKSLANDAGVILRVVDYPPGQKGMFHRTLSLDFGILFEGEIICELDNGEKFHMKAGDVCIQRGTIHSWQNPGDKPARVYFGLIASKPVEVGDKVFGSEGFHDDDVATAAQK